MQQNSLGGGGKEVLKVLKNKEGELSLISLFGLLFGSVLMVSAVVLNATDNSILNVTIINSTNNSDEDAILNNTFLNTSADANINLTNGTANLTTPLENVSVRNRSMISNGTINLTLPVGNFSPIETSNLTSNITINNQTYTIIPNQSINLSEGLFISSNITILNYSATIIENQSANNVSGLAKLFNEDNLDFDRDYKTKYLNDHKNFSNINFKKIIDKEDSTLSVGARNDNIKGFEINNSRFAIDLIGCNSYSKYCTFRINGVPTKQVYSPKDIPNKKTSFDLDEQYVMKVENIVFDFCDNRRFCHLGYEGYNIVNVSIEKKK